MSRSPADILRTARVARGFTSAAEAARHFGWHEATYTHHENGTRGIRKDVASKYARAFGLDAGTLLGLASGNVQLAADQGVPIVGSAAWGIWRDRSLMETSGTPKSIDIPQTSRPSVRMAVLVQDASIDKAILPGTYAIYETVLHEEAFQFESGKLLVIRREREGLEELSVRRILSAIDGELRLSSHLHSPHFREIITVRPQDDGIEVLGLVVGKYAPL